MVSNPAVIGTTFVLYLLLMLAIGWIAYRRTHDLSDYILGGRRLGPWVAALSAGASDMSGWLLLGLPGYAYASGMEASWLVLGLLAGTWLNWRLVARRLRSYSEKAGNALTLPAFFEQRFADRSRLLRVVSALFILLFFLFYTSSGLVAGGKLFETVFGLPYLWAVMAGTGTIIVYTFMGGFLAVSWTDLVQGLLMAAALLFVPLIAIGHVGGWNEALERVEVINPALLNPFSDSAGAPLGFLAIVSLLGWGLGYFGQPHILARFKAIRSISEVGSARRIAVSWTALTLLGAMLVGFAGNPYLEIPLVGADMEKVFMLLVGGLFHPLLAGILLAAILAAIMSTADSQLLVCSSVLTEDFYKALLRKQAGQRELVLVGRLAVVVIAVIAFILALDPESKVLELVAYAWAGFGAAFGPALLLSLYWKRMNSSGALAGIIAGGVTVVVWKQLSGGLFELYEIVPGVVVSTGAIIVVSLLSSPPPTEIIERHKAVVRNE
jgi:sodium/proline symporter